MEIGPERATIGRGRNSQINIIPKKHLRNEHIGGTGS